MVRGEVVMWRRGGFLPLLNPGGASYIKFSGFDFPISSLQENMGVVIGRGLDELLKLLTLIVLLHVP